MTLQQLIGMLNKLPPETPVREHCDFLGIRSFAVAAVERDSAHWDYVLGVE